MSYTFLQYDSSSRFFDKRRIHPFKMAARDLALNLDNYQSKSRKEQKAIEMILAVFLLVKTKPLFMDICQTSNIHELVCNLDNFYFAEWLNRIYLCPTDMIYDGFRGIFHLKNRYSAYHRLIKALKTLSIYSNNQLILYNSANKTEK